MSEASIPLLSDLLGPDRRSWWKRLLSKRRFPEFKPQVIYWAELRLTEMVLEDTTITWRPWWATAHMGHAVDLGYSSDGRLVGIKIWDDVCKPSVA